MEDVAADRTKSIVTLLTNTFRSFFPVILPGTDEYEAQRELESKNILNEFHRKYGRNCPNFIPSSFKGAIGHSQQEKKLLLIYVHSEFNQNTDKFVEDILCNPDFISFVSEKFCCWITSALSSDGYSLVNQTHAVEFPLLLLFSFTSENNTRNTISGTIVGQWEGLPKCNELISNMTNCYNQHVEQREREEAERIARETERRMKEEMEMEYARAMESDRQRLLAKQQEDEKKQLESAITISLQHEREVRLKQWEEKFEHEPSNIEGLCGNFRFSFPNGTKIQRKFLLEENLNTLFDYVEFILDKTNLKLNKFTLNLGYPKTVFRRDENNKSLKEHELIGNVALLVVEDNSEDE